MTEQEAIKEVKFNMSRIGLKEEAAKRVIEARNIAIDSIKKVEHLDEIKQEIRAQAIDELVEEIRNASNKIKDIRGEDAFFTIDNIVDIAKNLKGDVATKKINNDKEVIKCEQITTTS